MESEKLIEMVKGLLADMFNDLKEIQATVFAFDGEGLGVIPVGPLMENKEFVSMMIDKVRREFPMVFFATEVWMVERHESEANSGIVPSECEDRQEKVMLFVYEGNDMEMHTAEIIRSGSLVEIGSWKMNEVGKPSGRFCRPLQPDPRLN